MKALAYMADNGERGFVRARLEKLAQCSSLPQEMLPLAQNLATRVDATTQFVHPKPADSDEHKMASATATLPVIPVAAPQTPNSEAEPVSSFAQPPAPLVSQPDTPAAVPQSAPPPVIEAPPVPEKKIQEPQKPLQRPVHRRVSPPAPAVVSAMSAQSGVRLVQSVQATSENAKTTEQPLQLGIFGQSDYRNGDNGTSRFLRSGNTASIAAKGMTFSLGAVYLTSFGDKGDPETGTSSLGTKRESLRTRDNVFVPQIQYVYEDFSFAFGSSPLGGTVAPLPTAQFKYSGHNLGISLYNDVVTDSLLSYVGFRDVYTGKKMGRVMKAGSKLEWQDSFAEHWFYGGAVSGAYLYGENVKDNTAVKGEAYVGRNFGQISIGIYTSIDHFARDLDHFTYGHGGYYSPTAALSGAGFVSWEYKTDTMRFKADVNAGPLYEKIRDSSRYYLTSESGEKYQGATHHKFTTNSGMEAAVKVSDTGEFTASARLITSGSFLEAKGGIGLRFSF